MSANQSGGDGMQQIDLTKLAFPQLTQLKNQLDSVSHPSYLGQYGLFYVKIQGFLSLKSMGLLLKLFIDVKIVHSASLETLFY